MLIFIAVVYEHFAFLSAVNKCPHFPTSRPECTIISFFDLDHSDMDKMKPQSSINLHSPDD